MNEIKDNLRAELLERLHRIAAGGDTERDHCDADEVLCELLIHLGYKDIVDAWEEVDKWYA